MSLLMQFDHSTVLFQHLLLTFILKSYSQYETETVIVFWNCFLNKKNRQDGACFCPWGIDWMAGWLFAIGCSTVKRCCCKREGTLLWLKIMRAH